MSIVAVGEWFHSAWAQTLEGNIKSTDTLKMAILSATPSLETAVHWSDVSADDISPSDETLTSVTVTETAAASWGVAWDATTAYSVGDVITAEVDSTYYLQRCVVAGTSGSSAPSFSAVYGEDTADDGTVTWVNCGTSITVFTAAEVTFTASSGTLSPTCAVIFDAETDVADTEPLMILLTFASTPTATSIEVSPNTSLGYAANTLP